MEWFLKSGKGENGGSGVNQGFFYWSSCYIGIILYFGHNCGNEIFMKVERAVDNAENRADVDKYNGFYYWKLWSSFYGSAFIKIGWL